MNLDRSSVTVSGVSSGGYAAVQVHVTFSSSFHGAGILAGGPYWCANDNLAIALSTCMNGTPPVTELVTVTKTTALSGFADDPSNLADDRVWLYSALNDTVVATSVVKATEAYYNTFINDPTTQMKAIYDHEGEHAQVTKYFGNPCMSLKSPYIDNCGFDAAGSMLDHIYGGLTQPVNHSGVGKIVPISQKKYMTLPYSTLWGMSEVGYVYIPPRCEDGKTLCKLHLALHGCEMSVANIGFDFVAKAGYNAWADANDMVILFPQVLTNTLNPKGCWDWWGYTGTDYASNVGVQPATMKAMVDALLDGTA